ncbi:hypothetical protein [Microbulbifer yueqingensis]|uniref:Uncharacterized protein n=1 Tax=Microbulbifer yueqingensis TaxID=658219 RepID=A0A1G9BX01_9GAMM|nr:hypothetical protein [Microbulbifer yueqingensis]SDK43903.1 hypothetical protein SAMN05216212_2395 [Microbulbifer yueqingensis]
MKKISIATLLLLGVFTALFFYERYSEQNEQRRQQTATLLSRCVNESLLSLFRLQANDWRRQSGFYPVEAQRLSENAAALPGRLLEGESFPEWQVAVDICEEFTDHSNAQHRIIFNTLGKFAALPVGDNRLLDDGRARRQLRRRAGSLEVGARAADRYLADLKRDFAQLVSSSGLSAATKLQVEHEVNAEVLDHYRKGHYSLSGVLAHLERVKAYYSLLVDNPRGWTLRTGSLYFHDRALRREVEQLNSAVLQGEGEFFANWAQVMESQ